MPSLVAHAVKLTARLTIKHDPVSADALVKHLRVHMNKPPLPTVMPRGVRLDRVREAPVRYERLTVKRPRQALLYLHGGGYVCGKTRTYHNLCSRLAKQLDAEVWLPDYRLAPEHPFPAAIEDATATFERMLEAGFTPEQITIAGDSAGGGLALGTLMSLRDRRRPLPRCAVLLSPLTDLRLVHESVTENDATDWMLGTSMLAMGHGLYTRTPEDTLHPYASPALGDFHGLPPLYITVCEQECLRDDAYAVAKAARRARVSVTLRARPDLLHVWPILVPVMPEAREDLARIVQFIRSTETSAARTSTTTRARGTATVTARDSAD
ncbi:MAG: alpha/beta hydrolase [Polyangiales bacterium]